MARIPIAPCDGREYVAGPVNFRRAIRSVAAACAVALAGVVPAAAEGPPERPDTRQVMFVGNNWDGTADIVDAHTFERLARINTSPTGRSAWPRSSRIPSGLAFFLAIRQAVGEGNDQFTDDMFTSHDGRFVYVSRPSFADVVGISLRTGEIVWRFPMEGQRSDHMAISPDGTSAAGIRLHGEQGAPARRSQRPQDGRVPLGRLPAREQLLEGRHARLPRQHRARLHADRPAAIGRSTDPRHTKGERYFQIVDANTMQVLERFDMGDKLAEAGHAEMESAVRPMALAPDERVLYAQISFHHGFIEYSFDEDRVLRVASLPVSEEAQNTPREEYLLDSAHHGLAMNAAGTKLCVAGTMSDYAAIVSRATFAAKVFPVGEKPYWSTNGRDDDHCWVSFSGDDKVGVFSYGEERQLAEIPVGDHPQRVRAGAVQHDLLAGLPVAQGARDNLRPRILVRGLPRRCARRSFRLRVRIIDQSRLRGARVAYKTRRLARTTRKRFRVRVPARRARAGRHRIRLRATDAAGNRARRVVTFRRAPLSRCG